MHRQPDNIWRVDYQLAAGADAAQALQPDQVQAFVQTHLDAIGEGHLPWTPVWTSVYRAGAMTLDAYRHGRILFAGNAAHAMPIFGVRGLNSGFDDADNLVWKLAAVLQGKGADALLDSYCSERRQAFHVNAENAMRSTEFMSPPHRGFDLMREACLSLAGRHPGIARLVNPRQTRAIAYAGSPLSTDDEGGGDWAPGAPLADGGTAGGGHLTDLLTPGRFTLLAFGGWPEQEALEALTASPAWRFLPCRCAAPAAHAESPQAGMAYLLRPDGHVCGRWRSPSLDTVLSAIERACGAQGAIQ
jgi:3-(3-hydroxy-phenyl)propionate hydroxylase